MKFRVLAVILCLLGSHFAAQTDAQKNDSFLAYDAAGLERGCKAIVSAGSKSWTKADEYDAARMMERVRGFLLGLNASFLFETERGEAARKKLNPIIFPRDEVLNANWYAPSILAFLKKYAKIIPPSIRDTDVLAAWLLECHPDSTPEDKTMAKIVLDGMKQKVSNKGK